MRLTGDGVVLRPWRAEDAPDLFGACGEPEIADWSAFPLHPDLGAIARWIAHQDERSFAITEPPSDVALGHCALHPAEDERTFMSWWLVREARGRGLATRAARALADHAFATGVATRLDVMVQPPNEASWRLAERLGAERLPGEVTMADRQGRRHAFRYYVLTQ